jgi:hypothetical protein
VGGVRRRTPAPRVSDQASDAVLPQKMPQKTEREGFALHKFPDGNFARAINFGRGFFNQIALFRKPIRSEVYLERAEPRVSDTK